MNVPHLSRGDALEPPQSSGPDAGGRYRLSSAANQAARDRTRLEASHQAVASEVIEFQVARQRARLASISDLDPARAAASLSAREREVLALVAAGRSDGEIAEALFISKKTASVHVANIKSKLGAASRVEIAMLASSLRLVPDDGAAGAELGPGEQTPRSDIVCPFKGLASFDVPDGGYFFGRERVVAELVARLAATTFVAVVGASGSGKSSAVRAGLVPSLQAGVLPGSRTWRLVVMRPGDHPILALGRALGASMRGTDSIDGQPAADGDAAEVGWLDRLLPGERLVLVVDQFEEAYGAHVDPRERDRFLDAVAALARDPGGRALVVVAIRSEFYGRLAEHRELTDLAGTSTVLLGPMTAEELTRAIELPARAAGLRMDANLAPALVADVLQQPGGLPLLSSTLLELWQRREGRALRVDAYRALGGITGAIGRVAEAVFDRLSEDDRLVARSIFLRLVTVDDAGVATRRRAPIAEIAGDRDGNGARVLKVLVDGRLLTVSEGIVEPAHEALLREWPRMRGWLEEDGDARRTREHLVRAAGEWATAGREQGELYRGARLESALDWATAHDDEPNDLEREFLEASRVASLREVERHRRTNRRLRVLLAGAATLLVVTVSAAGSAFLQGQRAEEQRQIADGQTKVADQQRQAAVTAQQNAADQTRLGRARELMASAIAAREQDPSLSKLLALQALKSNDQPTYQSMNALHQVLASDPIVARYRWPADKDGHPVWTQISPSGDLMVAGNKSNYFEVADPRTGSVLWSYPDQPVPAGVGAPYFSADGSQVMVGRTWADDQVKPPAGELGIVLLDARTGTPLRRIDVGPCGGAITAAASGRLLVRSPARGEDGLCSWPGDPSPLALVDVRVGASRNLTDHTWNDGTLSGDGRFAAYEVPNGDKDKSVVVDVDTGATVLQIDPQAVQDAFGTNAFARLLNGDGSLLLYGDKPMLVYSVAVGSSRPIAQLSDAAGESGGAIFDSTGQNVLATFRDGSLKKMDARWGTTVSTWPAIGVGQPTIAADGRTMLVGDPTTGTAVLLDAGSRGDLWDVPTCRGNVNGGSLTLTHGLAAALEWCSGDTTGTVQVVDVKTRALVASLPGWDWQQLAVSPDGTSFVGQEARGPHESGPLAVADARTGSVKVELQGMCWWNDSSPVDPEQQAGCKPYPATPFPFAQRTLRWSPDGSMIVAVDEIDQAHQLTAIWDARDGRLLHADSVGDAHLTVDARFSPDSRQLVLAHPGGVIETLAADAWTTSKMATLDQSIPDLNDLGLVGYSPDGSSLIGIAGLSGRGGATIVWIDPTTLSVTNSVPEADAATPKSAALSPNGASLAVGATDGSVRIWDAATGHLLQQMQFGSQVQGVAFIDDSHLAVAPYTGDLLVMTIDPTELANTVRASVIRPFTQTECTTYAIDPCPTLAQSKAP